MEHFYINQGSENNTLRIELVNDARYEFMKSESYNNAIQNADVTFTMKDENGVLKISNAPCTIVLSDDDTCSEHYIIEYQWKKRDTKNKGVFTGRFKIHFNDDLYEDGVSFPSGDLIVPIHEELKIVIK